MNVANNTWTRLETRGALVKRRYRHAVCTYKNKMYIFGGEFGGENGQCYNDFYEFCFGMLMLGVIEMAWLRERPYSMNSD